MKKSLINALTLSRIIFGLIFLYIVVCDLDKSYLFVVFTLVMLSDYFDGKLARRFRLNSEYGAKLDVFCDFIFIFLATLALISAGLIPFWFIFVIILKLAEFFKTSGRKLQYERLGHLVALMFYALPIVVILINSKNIILLLCIFITILAIISSIIRIKNMRRIND